MLKFTMTIQQIVHVMMTIDYIDNYVLVQFNRQLYVTKITFLMYQVQN